MSLIEQLNLLSAQAFRFGSADKTWDVGKQVWAGLLQSAGEGLISVEIHAQFPHGRARIRLKKDLGDREVKVTDLSSVANEKASPTFKDIGELCVPG